MGSITVSDTITAHPTSYDTTNYSYGSISSSHPMSNAYTDSSSTTYAQITWKTGRNAETYIYVRFDLSAIPAGATIKSVSAKAKGYINTTSSSRVTSRQMQLATGTTLKGSALTLSTSTAEQTFSDVGTWTRDELQNAGVKFYIKRGTSNTSSTYNLRIYGATITVTYEYQEVTYVITVTDETGTGAEAVPSEVEAGGKSVVKYYGQDLTDIVATDNGVDVTSQLVETVDEPESSEVTDVGTYGFDYNSSSGYYVSNNRGISKSAAVCKITFSLPVSAQITFSFINYAEEGYDFGVFGEIDELLSSNYYAAGSSGAAITDSTYRLACNTSARNTSSVQTLTYQMDAGEHFIYVKYSKDDASDDNNDTLQFKFDISLDEQPSYTPYYSYTLEAVSADHVIVFSYAGASEELYLKENSVYVLVSQAYKKINGVWVLQETLSEVFDPNTNYVRG